jgi:hypothetical protein
VTTEEEEQSIIWEAKAFAMANSCNNKAAMGVLHIRHLLAVIERLKRENNPEYKHEVSDDQPTRTARVMRR